MISQSESYHLRKEVRVTESQKGWDWKSSCPTLLKHGHLETPAQDHIQIALNRGSTTSLDNLCHSSVTLTVKNVFPGVEKEPPIFPFLIINLLSSLGSTEKSLALSSLQPPFQCLYIFINSPEPSLLYAEQSQPSQLFLLCEMFQSLIILMVLP